MRVRAVIRTTLLATTVMGGAGLAVRSIGLPVGIAGAAQPRALHPCWNVQLTIRPVQSSGATGHVGTMYRMHNILPGACTLFGYPGAKLLDRNFNSLPTHVRRGLAFLAGNHAPATVTLQGSRNAYFLLEWVHFPSPGETCPPARYLMITPPNDRLPVVIYAGSGNSSIVACGGNLTASPVSERMQL